MAMHPCPTPPQGVESDGLETPGMRNFLWLFGVLACIAVGARFHPQPPRATATPIHGELSMTWKEWNEAQGLRFQFTADLGGCRFGRGQELPVQIRESQDGATFRELYPGLRQEVEAALEEPCRGNKWAELTLRDGSHVWTVEVGTYAGPAQARILDILSKCSRVGDMRQVSL